MGTPYGPHFTYGVMDDLRLAGAWLRISSEEDSESHDWPASLVRAKANPRKNMAYSGKPEGGRNDRWPLAAN